MISILFDIDGTLILTDGAGQSAMDSVSSQRGTLRDRQKSLNYSGRTDRSIIRDHMNLYAIDETPQNVASYRDAFLGNLPMHLAERSGEVLPGVRESLEKLVVAKARLGLLTGNMRRAARMKLDHYGLADYFYQDEHVVGGFGDEHFDRNEVAEEALRSVRAHWGPAVVPEEIWVIGDTPLDIRCARHIKARVLAVATGRYSLDELQQHEPDFLVENMARAEAWWSHVGI